MRGHPIIRSLRMTNHGVVIAYLEMDTLQLHIARMEIRYTTTIRWNSRIEIGCTRTLGSIELWIPLGVLFPFQNS